MARTKLTDELALEIRELLASGDLTRREIAGRFGVSWQAIHDIGRRHTYRHVVGPDPAPKRSRSKSGYWGVTANGFGNRFFVSLYHDGVPHRLGMFRDAESGARAYDAKAQELGLPRERLNFPDERARRNE